MKKFIVLSIVLLMLVGFAITSSAIEVILYADQDINVGTLTVVVDGTNLVVTYAITAPWVLGETHLYVGSIEPTKSAPGKFPYGPESPEYAVSGDDVVYTIDLDDFETNSILPTEYWLWIAAHAEVTNPEPPYTICEPREETAWAYGCRKIRPNKNWAMYFWYRAVVVPE